MARGTFYSTTHDPRGTIYSAMDGPGGPLIVRHDYIPLQQVTEDLIICLVLEETTDKWRLQNLFKLVVHNHLYSSALHCAMGVVTT